MKNHSRMQVLNITMAFCFTASNFLISYLLFLPRIHQIERLGTGNQSHHARAPAASVAHHFDAPQPADAHSRWCTHASVGAAGPLHQPGWSLDSPEVHSCIKMKSRKKHVFIFTLCFPDCPLTKDSVPTFQWRGSTHGWISRTGGKGMCCWWQVSYLTILCIS